MSRSDSEQIKNPAKMFLQWDGTKGGFNYWDKNKGEKGEKVHVPLPVSFMVLDTLATIKGYSDKNQSGFYSNEIRDISKDTLIVRNKTGIVAKGVYSEITANKACTGVKFCQSVYVSMEHEGKTVIGNIQMMGTALSAWIDFGKANKIYKIAVKVEKMIEGKKGVTKYQTPVFEAAPVIAEEDAKAIEMDKELKAYLGAYFNERQKELTELKEETATPNE